MESTFPANNLTPLPPDLYRFILEAFPVPLHVYLALMGTSHHIRLAIRGIPHQLSFECDDVIPSGITADALASIVGPCKDLLKLTLPRRILTKEPAPLVGCGLTEAACLPWVKQAFAGHDRLAVLRVPWADPLFHSIVPILKHLPGLAELHFLGGGPLHPDFLSSLARLCPGLHALRLWSPTSPAPNSAHYNELIPLAGSLRELAITSDPEQPYELHDLLARLAHLEGLQLSGRCLDCDIGFIPAACLTHLTLQGRFSPFRGLIPAGCAAQFCRLESLALDIEGYDWTVTTQLLNASRTTLQSVSLVIDASMSASGDSILKALTALPRLRRLHYHHCGLPPHLLPADMIDRLEYLALDGPCEGPGHIASSNLRVLRLSTSNAARTLDCPALEELTLVPQPRSFFMECHRLRFVEEMPDLRQSCCYSAPAPMDILVPPFFAKQQPVDAPRLPGCPGLRSLSFVRVPSMAALNKLLSMSALTRLWVAIGVLDMPASPILRLPQHLEHLELNITEGFGETSLALRLEAAGLRALCLRCSPDTIHIRLVLQCPDLVSLALEMVGLTTVAMDEGTAPPLRYLRTDPRPASALDAASLVALLAQHGAHLRHVALPCCLPSFRTAWPEMATAIGGLPRLSSLLLDPPAPNVTLACPSLRKLLFPGSDDLMRPPMIRSLELDCPLLEELEAPFGEYLERFELPAASNLRRIASVADKWVGPLKERFPEAILVEKPRGRGFRWQGIARAIGSA
ncbi:hypothetical protein PAPYR_6633 [Paratrimastix pyriformis]|uniref:Uncharacterized protein n=1 Tax=Paratrimastix pyriformis TaxID=342808 RepID=A0ABQ8UM19_9EUKA|nr:hypothetical protein PAPYR_6633 [Paratrimastix pyriformis]